LDTIAASEIVTNKTPENKTGKNLLVSIVIGMIVVLCSASLTYIGWIIYRSRRRRNGSIYIELTDMVDNSPDVEDINLNSSSYFLMKNTTDSNDENF